MLSGSSQLVCRNEHLFSQGRWLVVNPTEAEIFAQLPTANIFGAHQYFDVYQQSLNAKQAQSFGAELTLPADGQAFDGVLIYLPKAKAHTAMLVANAQAIVREGGTIAIVGSNDAGAKSIGKQFKATFHSPQKYDAARHCALWLMQSEQQKSFNFEDYLKVSTYSLDDIDWQVAGLPGVFSADGIDVGTELLLRSLPPIGNHSVLDFACGAGVIGSYILRRFPEARVSFSDINALALYACEKTLALNNQVGTVRPSNGLAEWQQTFDRVVTNPPFHTGKSTDYSITETFIKQVAKHLNALGALVLVANRFLPYPELIDKSLNRQPDLARSNKFCVYHALKK
ncbi:class I SAM-dependent methyltransferase [Alteromonas sp. ASW11-36]|uniref:Ribosomal RNA small subunit methyltransferase C n=1 Tax=Alteromonas arenosi TaxID=3055817 RepID=A0ABT7SSI2_9ALTE|nr:class I SAM-dependent methyltransferase [Alteromonas sp. ASW11-36]MDM7859116.1 class I SAM-dependent methyltransferase [Alteromonas sp. ASW11-36]